MIFIYSKDSYQAEALASWLGLHRDGWRFLVDRHTLAGYEAPHVLRWGTPWERRDNHEILTALGIVHAHMLDINDDVMRFAHARG
jgi:hypothetical protein